MLSVGILQDLMNMKCNSMISCLKCGYVFPQGGHNISCPECGSRDRSLHVVDNLVLNEKKFQGKQFREGYPGKVIKEFKKCEKTSKGGRPAKEELTIDRSDPLETIKIHKVEEQEVDGTWITVHNHEEKFSAKRRPKTNLE